MRKEDKTDEVKRLISMGKEKGFLTYRDLNSTLPADMVTSDRLSSLMTMFGEMDIEIIDSPESERYQQMMSEGEGTTEEAEEAGETEEEDKKIDLTPGDLNRTDDPVRLYLKEMGSVSLLSREGEIEIAKRIEEGKQDISTVVFGMPMTIKAVFALIDQVKANKVPIRKWSRRASRRSSMKSWNRTTTNSASGHWKGCARPGCWPRACSRSTPGTASRTSARRSGKRSRPS